MNQRTQVVYSLLAEYLRSPSLRHMREERSLAKLALDIVTKLDRDNQAASVPHAPDRRLQRESPVHGRQRHGSGSS